MCSNWCLIQSLCFINIFCNFFHYSKGITKISISLEIRSQFFADILYKMLYQLRVITHQWKLYLICKHKTKEGSPWVEHLQIRYNPNRGWVTKLHLPCIILKCVSRSDAPGLNQICSKNFPICFWEFSKIFTNYALHASCYTYLYYAPTLM